MIKMLSNEHIEAQWVRIHRPSCKDYMICNMYLPPNSDLSKAVVYLEDCLNTLIISKTDVFLLGDMNVDYTNNKIPRSVPLQES